MAGHLSLVQALGLEAPSQRLLDGLSDRAAHALEPPATPIFVPRWRRPGPPVPPVDQNQAAQEPAAADGLAEGVNTEKSAPEDSAETGTSGTQMKA
jgi:hypothetical protein